MQIKKMIPSFAIATGLALAMITSGFKEGLRHHNNFVMHTFEYNPPGGSYSQANVQNDSNWTYTSSTAPCSNQDVKACRIFVPDNDVTQSGSSYVLKSGFKITGSTGSSSFVVSTDAGSGNTFVSNKSGL